MDATALHRFVAFAATQSLSFLIHPLSYISAHLALCQHPYNLSTRDLSV